MAFFKSAPVLAARRATTASARVPLLRASLLSARPTVQAPVSVSVPGARYVTGKSTAKWNRQAAGPFSFPAAILFILTGGGLLWYFKREKDRVEAEKLEEQGQQIVGRPKVGGPFNLILASLDPQTKKPIARRISNKDLEGRFTLLYFGFTNCPDICPEELDKMGDVVDAVEKEHGEVIEPVFISCDPARDTIPTTAAYVSEFHPKLLGLTGHYDDVKHACKVYRVYFSTPPGVDPSTDYLVDHSIYFYLMDPEGRFVEAFGRSSELPEVREKVLGYIKKWKENNLPTKPAGVKKELIVDKSRELFSLEKYIPPPPPKEEAAPAASA